MKPGKLVRFKLSMQKIPVDPVTILNNAKAFQIAAERLSEERMIYPNNLLQIPVVPLVVSLAFGLEMALKSILAHTSNFPKTHELISLFNKLPAEIQNSVASNLATTPFEVRMQLTSANKAFLEWRYFYEYNNLTANPIFMGTLLKTLISTSECLLAGRSSGVL